MNAVLQILFLSICNILFYYAVFLSAPYIRRKGYRTTTILVTIVLYSIVMYYVLQNAYYSESFFFEVSPQRKICMQEQVLPIEGGRSSFCCGKGTTGGYPARYLYKDLINPGDGWDWNRVDAYGNEASVTPPTDQC